MYLTNKVVGIGILFLLDIIIPWTYWKKVVLYGLLAQFLCCNIITKNLYVQAIWFLKSILKMLKWNHILKIPRLKVSNFTGLNRMKLLSLYWSKLYFNWNPVHKIFFNCLLLYMIVNTNSKHKEDDFTDSIAVNFSQDVCIHTVHVALAPSFPTSPSTHPSPQSG